MKGKDLFFRRWVKGWKYQYNVIKSVADWTVMLYIIIPAAVFFSIIYRSWWSELPTWFHDIPLILIFSIFYLISWAGTIRTYVEEADKVFLIKKNDLIWKLKKYGYYYSIILQTLTVVAAIFILLPFLLHHYHMGWLEITSWGIYFISLKACFMFIKYLLRNTLSRISQIIVGIVVFFVFSWINQWIFIIIGKGNFLPLFIGCGMVLSVLVYFSLRQLRFNRSMDRLIDMEQERKTSLIQFFFAAAPEMEKPVVIKRNKPLLFRKSKRIFKKRTPITGFMELFIKTFIRNKSYVRGYLTLISVTTIAMVRVPPIWIKVLIFLGFLFMLRSWLTIIWNKVFSSHPLMKKYNDSDFYFSAKSRAIRGMYLAAITILSIFVTIGLVLIQ
ncbi:ABC transporter permease [Neobacillus dielmonensis]|uniref:ABC transporter permease n=1 Tax=Neobacillus dielmonensis TaxID=1347369 RepID=UPI0005A8ADDC|nr:ABC transporter permease [Neobacillus dielmonensis]